MEQADGRRPGRFVAVCPAGWTADEDIEMLLDAMELDLLNGRFETDNSNGRKSPPAAPWMEVAGELTLSTPCRRP